MVMVSAYALVPASKNQLMREYLKSATGERVMYRQTPAWIVELPTLRRVQREWANQRHGEPTVEKCLHLLGLASGNLFKRVPEKGFPWKECFWREELCRLKVAAVKWLAQQTGIEPRHVWLKHAAIGWLGNTPLSLDECRFATSNLRDMVPVLIADDAVAAAMPAFTDQWEGAPVVTQVPNLTDRQGRRQHAETIATRLWNFLPSDEAAPVPDIVNTVHSWSVSWPGDEMRTQRNSDGRRTMPDWLRELRRPSI